MLPFKLSFAPMLYDIVEVGIDLIRYPFYDLVGAASEDVEVPVGLDHPLVRALCKYPLRQRSVGHIRSARRAL